MQKFFLLVSFLLIHLNAAALADETNVKPIIGVIDWRAAVFSSEGAKKENEKLKIAHERDTERLKVLESRIRNNQQRLEKNKALMSADDKEKLLGELQKDIIDYQQLGQNLQQTIQQKEQEFITSQRINMKEAVEKISKEKGLQVILTKDAVFYSETAIDITPDVIKYLNTKK